jgi:hypothetical protein
MTLGALTVACASGVPGSDLTITFGPPAETSADADSATDSVIDATTGLGPSSGAEVSTQGAETNVAEESTDDMEATMSATMGSTSAAPATCGDDVAEGTEVCDGQDLGGQDCMAQGFDGGTLGCAGDCSDYDTSACTVIECGNGAIEGMETCDGAELDGQTCMSQGFDGGALACVADCSTYNTSACVALVCIEEDIGGSVGAGVTSGSTAGEDEDIAQSCALGGAVDHVIYFVAPATATFVFDTFGSGYDTALAAYGTCDAGSEVICNDDTGGLQSEIQVALNVGDGVVVTVSGYSGLTGNWVLNIAQI